MFLTLGNTFSLIGTSWRLLRNDGLLMFPLATGCSLLFVMLYALVAFKYGGTFDRLANGFSLLPADFIFLGLAYLGVSFVIVYFSSALVAALHHGNAGGTPDFRFGLEAANDRLGAIALWSVVAGTAGLVVKQMASSGWIIGKAGGLLAELLSGWATFLVVPVMMVEGSPPIDAMRRSTDVFKETWGRQLVGNFGFGVLYFALLVVSVLLSLVSHLAGVSSGVAVLCGMMLFALPATTLKCLETVFVLALYDYATRGETNGAFSESVLRKAYVYKHAKGNFVSPPARRRAAV